MGVSQERSRERKQEYAANVKARNASRGELQPIYVEDILKVIQKLKKSNDPYEQSLAVLLATGSRSVELFKVSKYYEVPNDPTHITVKGISKDKGNRGYANITIQRPLVGLAGSEVVELSHEIRDELNLKGNNTKISNTTNTALNKSFKEWIQPLAPDFLTSSHKCRYIYANVAFLLFGKPKRIPYESFLNEILAHASSESTKSYLGINVQFREKVIAKAPDDIKALFEHEIKQMKQQIDTNCPDKTSSVDLSEFRNSHRRTLNYDAKVEAVVNALKLLKDKKIKMTQRDLRGLLQYSASIMTAGYAQARREGII
jgi:hypothetical protein